MENPGNVKGKNHHPNFRKITIYISIALLLLQTFLFGWVYVYKAIPLNWIALEDGSIIYTRSFQDLGEIGGLGLIVLLMAAYWLGVLWANLIVSVRNPLTGGISWLLLTVLPLYTFIQNLIDSLRGSFRDHYLDLVILGAMVFVSSVVLGILFLKINRHQKKKLGSKGIVWLVLIVIFLVAFLNIYIWPLN